MARKKKKDKVNIEIDEDLPEEMKVEDKEEMEEFPEEVEEIINKLPTVESPEKLASPNEVEVGMPQMPEMQMATLGEKEDVFGPEEAIAKAVSQLTKFDKIDLLTELSEEEIKDITIATLVGNFIYKETGNQILLTLCDTYKVLKVSLDRKGRTEIVGLGTFMGFGESVGGKKGKMGGVLPGA